MSDGDGAFDVRFRSTGRAPRTHAVRGSTVGALLTAVAELSSSAAAASDGASWKAQPVAGGDADAGLFAAAAGGDGGAAKEDTAAAVARLAAGGGVQLWLNGRRLGVGERVPPPTAAAAAAGGAAAEGEGEAAAEARTEGCSAAALAAAQARTEALAAASEGGTLEEEPLLGGPLVPLDVDEHVPELEAAAGGEPDRGTRRRRPVPRSVTVVVHDVHSRTQSVAQARRLIEHLEAPPTSPQAAAEEAQFETWVEHGAVLGPAFLACGGAEVVVRLMRDVPERWGCGPHETQTARHKLYCVIEWLTVRPDWVATWIAAGLAEVLAADVMAGITDDMELNRALQLVFREDQPDALRALATVEGAAEHFAESRQGPCRKIAALLRTVGPRVKAARA